MNKVVCPHCGLVNLDKFVTYPNCAGCGARLPDTGQHDETGMLRKPLRASWWATIIAFGCGVLAMAVVGITRETSRREDGHLVAYSQVPRETILGRDITAQYMLDQVEDGGHEVFSDVRLRLSRILLDDFELVSAQPLPTSVFETSGGRYLIYGAVPRETPLRLQLRPLRKGEFRVNVQFYSREFYPLEVRNYVTVKPRVIVRPEAVSPPTGARAVPN